MSSAAHVGSEHFQAATRELPRYLTPTPRIVSVELLQDDWSELGEPAVGRD